MRILKPIYFASLLVLTLISTAVAQESAGTATQISSLTITANASGDRLRVTAPSSVMQMRLEVYAATGVKLFDEELRGANVFDWHLQDGQAQRLPAGDYVCVVTAKTVAGKITQKVGGVTVAENSASVRAGDTQQFTSPQAQAIGPVEANSSWTIVAEGENKTTTVIANTGSEGQMIRGRGALTFRLGDFFSGKDEEQMRLTEEGNLGIGTSTPQAKLDVAGVIRAERFLIAKPGTSGSDKTTSANAATDASNSLQPLTGGSGITGKLTKWIDGPAGTLGDSVITESPSGNIGVGTANPQAALQVRAGLNRNIWFRDAGPAQKAQIMSVADDNGTINTLSLDAAPLILNSQSGGNVGIGTASPQVTLHVHAGANKNIWFRDAGPTQKTQVMSVADDNSTINTLSVDAAPLILNSQSGGNVGIGTASPQVTLHVHAGANKNIWFRDAGPTQKAQIMSVADDNGTINTLSLDAAPLILNSQSGGNVGIGMNPVSKLDVAGDINTSTGFNIGGNRVLSVPDSANTFAGIRAGASNPTGGGNSFFGNDAGQINVAGEFNSFFGDLAGFINGSGSNNAFFGASAGQNNTSGGSNVFIGTASGLSNTIESHNTFIGTSATGVAGITNATAIGSNAKVTGSDSLVLGSINTVNGATSNTKVGIGTPAPSSVLHIVSDAEQIITASTSWHGGTWFNLANTDTGGRTWNLISSASQNGEGAGKLLVRDASAGVRMTFDTTGNVGIGTTSPGAGLHVSSPSFVALTAESSNITGTWFNLANTGTGGRAWNLVSTASGNSEGAGKLLIRDNNASAVRATFDSLGNLGIGTTAPNAKLHVVQGDVAITTQSYGVILRATDDGTGTKCFRLTVNSAGTLSTFAMACP